MSSYSFRTSKDEAETIDFTIDYTNLLNGAEPADVLIDSAWRIETTDANNSLTEVVNDFTASTATIMVTGGTKTNRYRLINTVDTVAGRVFERSILVDIKNK